MLTIRFDDLGLRQGDLVLDVGAGFGRHVFECARRGADVIALDYAEDEVVQTRATLGGMVDAGEIPIARFKGVLRGDATRLPFADDSFDVVITSEVLEHIQDDVAAIAEMVRVLKPGGRFAATVPAQLPETINWKLSDEYHAPKSPGGHVRIYSRTELTAKLRAAGLVVDGYHRAHALHSPYCGCGARSAPPTSRTRRWSSTASSSSGRSSRSRAAPASPRRRCRRCSARAACTMRPSRSRSHPPLPASRVTPCRWAADERDPRSAGRVVGR